MKIAGNGQLSRYFLSGDTNVNSDDRMFLDQSLSVTLRCQFPQWSKEENVQARIKLSDVHETIKTYVYHIESICM